MELIINAEELLKENPTSNFDHLYLLEVTADFEQKFNYLNRNNDITNALAELDFFDNAKAAGEIKLDKYGQPNTNSMKAWIKKNGLKYFNVGTRWDYITNINFKCLLYKSYLYSCTDSIRNDLNSEKYINKMFHEELQGLCSNLRDEKVKQAECDYKSEHAERINYSQKIVSISNTLRVSYVSDIEEDEIFGEPKYITDSGYLNRDFRTNGYREITGFDGNPLSIEELEKLDAILSNFNDVIKAATEKANVEIDSILGRK